MKQEVKCPGLVLELLSLSIAFILSAAFVKYRDISFIWEVFTQMFFYLTPILYPVSYILDKYEIGKLVMLNPLAQIIQDLRYILVTPQSQTAWQLLGKFAVIPVMLVFVLGAISVWYFKREAKYFAENV